MRQVLLVIFDSGNPGIHLVEQVHFAWLSYSVGVDGANVLFIPLTAILTLLALVYTLITRHDRDHLFIACLLGYQGILIGAFAALNLMQFWLWNALELVPVVLLTIYAGTGKNRRRVVTLLLQYWGSGLLMTLAGFMLLAFGLIDADHALTFDWLTLKRNNAYLHDEVLIFILLFFGFAIRMPLFPFHGWLPMLAEQGTVASAAIFMVGLEGSLLLSIAYGLAAAGMLFSVGLIYERTRTAFIPRLGGLFDTNSEKALLFLISALSTMVMSGTPGYDAAHLLIEGVIEENGWLTAIAILIGNVLAAAFLLRAF